jgi:hypothetical protein
MRAEWFHVSKRFAAAAAWLFSVAAAATAQVIEFLQV